MPSHSTPRWNHKLELWLQPFLHALPEKAQRHWAPFYLRGLIAPGGRKSMECIADRVAPGERQQIHHFVSTSPWEAEPLEQVLTHKAQALVGGEDSTLIVDDTALVKKGTHSVGVAHQYCGELGKQANCQVVVTLTLARGALLVPVASRLFLPESWSADRERSLQAGVPEEILEPGHRTKPQIALAEIDRLRSLGVTFGWVGADAGYGASSEFRQGLSRRGLLWAVGVEGQQRVYPREVELLPPARSRPGGTPAIHPRPSTKCLRIDRVKGAWEKRWGLISWREGSKGPLQARFWAARIRMADGTLLPNGSRLPGEEELWLIGEKRSTGEVRYYVSNFPRETTRRRLAEVIKARWSCEQGHQQMKEELGLDHFEGRSWGGLHHHMLLVRIAYCFLTELRKGKKKRPAHANPARDPAPDHEALPSSSALSSLPQELHSHKPAHLIMAE